MIGDNNIYIDNDNNHDNNDDIGENYIVKKMKMIIIKQQLEK